MTPLSGATTYLTPEGFLQRADRRSVAALLSDTGTPVADPAGSVALLTLLQQASGQLESHCLRGERYTPADLAALTGNSANYRDAIIAALVMQQLRDRRLRAGEERVNAAEWAQKELKALADGLQVFGVLEAAEAGQIEAEPVTQAARQQAAGATFQARRYFGVRAADLR